METYGLIGNPVGHSLSPLIHDTISRELSIDSEYRLFLIERDLGGALKRLYEEGAGGLNVTVPYKSEVIPYLKGVDPLALSIGAVNTLKRAKDGFIGYNTDIEGLLRAIREEGVSIRDRECLVLGAGGAARAAAFLFLREGAGGITIINRSLDKAERIASDLISSLKDKKGAGFEGEKPWPIRIEALPLSDIGKLEGKGYIAVQCTSVGLKPDIDRAVIEDPEFYKKLSFAVDAVYSPFVTRFMQLCRDNGVRAINGLSMLLYQAVYAYELWHEVLVPAAVIEKAYQALLNARPKNIILTGFMGAGKSSVGIRLAERLSCGFADTDELIVKREGKSINEIFAEKGEAYFRDLETLVVKELSEKSRFEGGMVLSVGGGLPVRESNRAYLKKIGTVVYLRAREDTLLERVKGSSDRPLLKEDMEKRLHELYNKRRGVYEDSADVVIDTDDLTLEETVLKGERIL